MPKLAALNMPRCLIPQEFGTIAKQELFTYSDASEVAIGHIIYMRSENKHSKVHVAFVNANSRVAPTSATSMPRLELCAALQAALATQEILEGHLLAIISPTVVSSWATLKTERKGSRSMSQDR